MLQDFHAEEVTWHVEDIPVYATLTRPPGDGPFPAIIFVAGSGPTDRDWCSPLLPGNTCSGRLLAEVLTEEGFITLRYDKRIAGSHATENYQRMMGTITLQGHTDELAGGVNLLRSYSHVDASRMFVLTNSEGAIHALHYQLQPGSRKFSGMVLTSAPGCPIRQVARTQVIAQIANSSEYEILMQRFDAAIADILAGRQAGYDPTLPKIVNILLQSLAAPANQPFSLELWSTNPAELLARVKEPVLVVIGKKDIQVSYQTDGRALENAVAGYNNVTFVYPEDADHVLKYELASRESRPPAEVAAQYNADDRILDPETVRLIVQWLRGRIRE